MIKLTSGETILAEIVSQNDYNIEINNPIAVMIKMRHAPVLMSHVWMPFDDFDNYYDIRHEHVITQKGVDEDMVIYYNNCIDTIHDNMTSSETFLLDGSEEKTEDKRLEEIIEKLEAQYHYSANTVIH
jgi:hypothetical protein